MYPIRNARSALVTFMILALVYCLVLCLIALIPDRQILRIVERHVGTPYYQSSASSSGVSQCSKFEDVKHLPLRDSCLLRYLRAHRLRPPSLRPYGFRQQSDPSQFKNEIQRMFRNVERGFFVECGANDGLFLSNTLGLERIKKWSGLLVEAHPVYGKRLIANNRKAWVANVCLSPYNNITEIEMIEGENNVGSGELLTRDNPHSPTATKNITKGYFTKGTVHCFPLQSLLAAIGVNHVHYLALDVQGVELKILKTLPFDDTLIVDVIQVENNMVPEGKEALRQFVESKGYKLIAEWGGFEYVFKRM